MASFRLWPGTIGIKTYYRNTHRNAQFTVRKVTAPRKKQRQEDIKTQQGWDKSIIVPANLRLNDLPKDFDLKALKNAKDWEENPAYEHLQWDLCDAGHRREAFDALHKLFKGKFPATWNLEMGIVPYINLPIDLARKHGFTINDFQKRAGMMTFIDWLWVIWDTYEQKEI